MNAALKFAAIAMTLCHWVSAQTVVLSETFGGTFPQGNGWTLNDTGATWGKVTSGFGNHVAANGGAFAYCAALGNVGTPKNPVYPSERWQCVFGLPRFSFWSIQIAATADLFVRG